MKRRNFTLGAITMAPLSLLSIVKSYGQERNGAGFKVNSGEARFGQHYKMKGVTSNILDIKISSSDTHGDLAVFEQTGLSPNGGPPLHIHWRQDEWFYVIEGAYLFQVGSEKFEMRAGDTIFLPRNVPHAFMQRSQTGKMIVSYLPAGKMEAFFKITDAWSAPPSPDVIASVFELHEMKIVGPPLTDN